MNKFEFDFYYHYCAHSKKCPNIFRRWFRAINRHFIFRVQCNNPAPKGQIKLNETATVFVKHHYVMVLV